MPLFGDEAYGMPNLPAIASHLAQRYDIGMTSPVIFGQVEAATVTPTRLAAPSAGPAHAFFNVVRDLIQKAGYHNEAEVLDALNAVAGYERQVMTTGDLRQVTAEDDRAPLEDVSQRKPPNQIAITHAPVGPAIDYMALARALAAVQQEQQDAATGPVVPAQ